MNEKNYADELKVLYDKAVDNNLLGLAMELLDKRRAAQSCATANTATQAIKNQS